MFLSIKRYFSGQTIKDQGERGRGEGGGGGGRQLSTEIRLYTKPSKTKFPEEFITERKIDLSAVLASMQVVTCGLGCNKTSYAANVLLLSLISG